MTVTDPQELLDKLDSDELIKYLSYNPIKDTPAVLEKFHLEGEMESSVAAARESDITYYEPYGTDAEDDTSSSEGDSMSLPSTASSPVQQQFAINAEPKPAEIIQGRVMRLGDFIDTDAVSPPVFASSQPCNSTRD